MKRFIIATIVASLAFVTPAKAAQPQGRIYAWSRPTQSLSAAGFSCRASVKNNFPWGNHAHGECTGNAPVGLSWRVWGGCYNSPMGTVSTLSSPWKNPYVNKTADTGICWTNLIVAWNIQFTYFT